MFSLFHSLSGYCKIVLMGREQERFLNLCAARNLLLWKIRRNEQKISFYISRKGYQELEEISQKTGCIYRCEEQRGLPYFWKRYRKRKILAGSLLSGLVLFLVLSQFIWQIHCIESGTCSEEEMRDYLKKENVVLGTAKKKISCEILEEQIRRDFPKIAWVSCAIKGTILQIQWKETLPIEVEPTETEEEPCDLIAQKSGKISSIVVRNGQAMVEPGDHVKKGDVLISGTVPILDDGGTVVEQLEVPADGEIYATTKYRYENSISYLQYEKQYSGKEKGNLEVLAGGYRVGTKRTKVPFDRYDIVQETHFLHLGEKWYFPLAFCVTTVKEYDIKKKRLTKEEAKQQLEQYLSQFFQQSEAEGLTFLKKDVTIEHKGDKSVASGTLVVRERFGKKQKKTSTGGTLKE